MANRFYFLRKETIAQTSHRSTIESSLGIRIEACKERITTKRLVLDNTIHSLEVATRGIHTAQIALVSTRATITAQDFSHSHAQLEQIMEDIDQQKSLYFQAKSDFHTLVIDCAEAERDLEEAKAVWSRLCGESEHCAAVLKGLGVEPPTDDPPVDDPSTTTTTA